MVNMILCPNCRTIQREGEICPLCSCPVEKNYRVRKRTFPKLEEQARKQHGFPSPYAVQSLLWAVHVPQPG